MRRAPRRSAPLARQWGRIELKTARGQLTTLRVEIRDAIPSSARRYSATVVRLLLRSTPRRARRASQHPWIQEASVSRACERFPRDVALRDPDHSPSADGRVRRRVLRTRCIALNRSRRGGRRTTTVPFAHRRPPGRARFPRGPPRRATSRRAAREESAVSRETLRHVSFPPSSAREVLSSSSLRVFRCAGRRGDPDPMHRFPSRSAVGSPASRRSQGVAGNRRHDRRPAPLVTLARFFRRLPARSRGAR